MAAHCHRGTRRWSTASTTPVKIQWTQPGNVDIFKKVPLFGKKSELLENFDEIPLNRSVQIGLGILLGISSYNFRFFGGIGLEIVGVVSLPKYCFPLRNRLFRYPKMPKFSACGGLFPSKNTHLRTPICDFFSPAAGYSPLKCTFCAPVPLGQLYPR